MYGVAFILTPEMADRIVKVTYESERIIEILVKLREAEVRLIQVYAPQQGRSNREKDEFYEKLQYLYDTDEGMRNTIIMGDINGHVGTNRQGIARVIGEFSIGDRNPEGKLN